jgi:hypothetical protein
VIQITKVGCEKLHTRDNENSGKPFPMCLHQPQCPSADASDREAAHTIACHPEQGWSLLCNGVLLFDDTGGLLPDGRVIRPHRPTDVPVFYTAA